MAEKMAENAVSSHSTMEIPQLCLFMTILDGIFLCFGQNKTFKDLLRLGQAGMECFFRGSSPRLTNYFTLCYLIT